MAVSSSPSDEGPQMPVTVGRAESTIATEQVPGAAAAPAMKESIRVRDKGLEERRQG